MTSPLTPEVKVAKMSGKPPYMAARRMKFDTSGVSSGNSNLSAGQATPGSVLRFGVDDPDPHAFV
jgi:hypothetical protein